MSTYDQIDSSVVEARPQPPADSIEESLRLIDDLKFFLATAPANWQENQIIRRYYLNNQEGFISCVFWKNIYYITGTDIVRGISYKFKHFGRQIIDQKKFEEGIFSDLRSLKCGTDAVLENPRSVFLKFLHKNQCLKTQKKQKVFFWFSVPHDKLFSDALERDLKRELEGRQTATTKLCFEPSLSFKYISSKPLLDQVVSHLESKRLEKGFNDFIANESVVESDEESGIPVTELELSHNLLSQILLDTPRDGSTPLFVSDEITSQKVELPINGIDDDEDSDDHHSGNNNDRAYALGRDDNNEDNNEDNDDDDDDDDDYDIAKDDFPLDYFQLADALQELQDMLDPSLFFQSELSYPPLLIDQSEKLMKSTTSSAMQQQQQQQQYHPSYDEYPSSLEYSPFSQQQSTVVQDPYAHYLSYYHPYPQQLPYAIPPMPFSAFNTSYYEQLQHQMILLQQQLLLLLGLRGFPSSQATLPPRSAGIPLLGVFTTTGASTTSAKRARVPLSGGGKLVKSLKKKLKTSSSNNGNGNRQGTKKKDIVKKEHETPDFNEFFVPD